MPTETSQQQFEAQLKPVLSMAYATAFHLTHHRDDAADLVQDAALQAYRALPTFQPGTNFKAWFLRILTNLFLTQYRRKRRGPEIEDIEDASDLYLYLQIQKMGLHTGNSDPAFVVLSALDSEQVSEAIAALPEEYRVVATLYFVEEFSYQEIAGIVDCPVGTVRSRLHRSRKILQKALWHLVEAQSIPASQSGRKINHESS